MCNITSALDRNPSLIRAFLSCSLDFILLILLLWKSNRNIIHSSVCIRKKIFQNYKYDENFLKAQDYKLWQILAKNKIQFENLPQKLITLNKLKPPSILDVIFEIKVKYLHNSLSKNFFLSMNIPIILIKTLVNNIFYN